MTSRSESQLLNGAPASGDGRAMRTIAEGKLRVEHVPLARLRPWPQNPRLMPEAEMEKLRRSIQTFGFVEPLVVRRSDQLVVGGHQRLEAAKGLGLTRVPVVYIEVTDAEAKALNLALNKIQGSWDLPKLGALLDQLQGLPDFDVSLTGFDLPEIDGLLGELARQGAPSPREESFPQAAEALQDWAQRAPTRVSAGELWQLGRHRLLCGDSLVPGSLEKLTGGRPVDLVVTDPPYGIDYESSQAAPGRRKKRIANDQSSAFESFLDRALPVVKAQMKRGSVMYWFASGGGPNTALAKVLLAIDRIFNLSNVLVWDRVDPGLGWRFRRSWEAIVEASVGRPRVWHGGKEQCNVLRYPRAIPQAGDHPTPKPIPLLEKLIACAAPARGSALDPFGGSGSTLVAAERTGRICYLAELEPRYCDIALARWEALTGQQATRPE
jgi:DNA modification methylase